MSTADDRFGSSVDLDGDLALVGAPGGNGGAGAAHEFRLGTLYQDGTRIQLPGPDTQHHHLRATTCAPPPARHHLRATDARAGDFYVFLGTFAGTSPGTFEPISGLTIPINADVYTTYLLDTGGAGLASPFGMLDSNGEAQSSYTMPAGLPPAFAGLELHHCFLIIDATTLAFDQVSNAVPARIE